MAFFLGIWNILQWDSRGVGTLRGGPGILAGTGLAGISSPGPDDRIVHAAGQ